jgi:predicted TPR repeat methyltransferase
MEPAARNSEPEPADLSVPDAIALAVRCQRAGDLGAAEHLYRAVLELVPRQPDALHFLGVLAHQQGDSQRGVELIRQAIAEAPSSSGMRDNLGNVLYEAERFAEAAAAYRDAIRISPEARSYNNLGAALRAQRRFDEARAAYERALELDPKHANAHHNLANLLASRGHVQEAVEHYCTAITLMPSLAGAYRQLGIAYSMLGRKEEAAGVYREWLSREPDNSVARHMLAACSGQGVPGRASDECVVQMFDAFARSFDVKLAKLDYRAPELCRAALAQAVGSPAQSLATLDAGCGTGLCGALVAPFASQLTGVDLSAQMLAQARRTGHYDELVRAELTEYLGSQAERFELILSADTLVYFGALEAVLGAAAGALRSSGLLIFSVERGSDELMGHGGHCLNLHGRYCHSQRYVERVLEGAGLRLVALEPGVLRNEGGRPVPGLIVTARKP